MRGKRKEEGKEGETERESKRQDGEKDDNYGNSDGHG